MLFYIKKWWLPRESNPARFGLQPNALPPELGSHLWRFVKQSYDLGQEEFLRELLIITE